MSIPRTSIERVEEGRVDSTHVEDLSQHLMYMKHTHGACAEIPMPEKKVNWCQTPKVLCTREFAVVAPHPRRLTVFEIKRPRSTTPPKVGSSGRLAIGIRDVWLDLSTSTHVQELDLEDKNPWGLQLKRRQASCSSAAGCRIEQCSTCSRSLWRNN